MKKRREQMAAPFPQVVEHSRSRGIDLVILTTSNRTTTN